MDKIFAGEVKVVNIGLPAFAKDLQQAGVDVVNLDWKPPAGGDEKVLELLKELAPWEDKINSANEEALSRVLKAEPVLVDIGLAEGTIPGFGGRKLLHAGPPVAWKDMCGPLRGAIIGAILFEGWAGTAEKAEELAASGEIEFAPCHEYGAVGPMAGVLAPSMPVFVVENRAFGNRAYSSFNEGLGKVLRFGAYNQEVLQRLKWLKEEFFPVVRDAVHASGGIELKGITSQALQMGDECHNRNKAATALLFRELAPILARTKYPTEQIGKAMEFIQNNEHFYLNISMAASKATMDAAAGISWSTMVTAMARNGTEFGIRISGLGDKWFIAPAEHVKGLYFPGYGEDDANLDLGDSTITETAGIGGFAMASAPAIVKFVGGKTQDAIEFTKKMYGITLGENTNYTIPNLDFRGAPVGIDLVKVIEFDTLPVINTGIAHKDSGVGQIGAGLVSPPLECFTEALQYFVREYGKGRE